ncbi:MAG: DUF2975 domain-containing protein [Flavobacterium sp.]
MKRLPLLKMLTTLLLVCTGAFVAFAIPFFLIAVFMPDKIPFTINEKWANEFAAEDYIMLAVKIISIGFYVYALYLFKNVLTQFAKKRLFSLEVIRNLDQAGKAVLTGFGVYVVAEFIYAVTVEGTFEMGITFESVFTIVTGLFLIVLSEVFMVAKGMKEENDLTV